MKKLIFALVILNMDGTAEAQAVRIKLSVTAYCEHQQVTASGTKPDTSTVAFPPYLINKLGLKYGQLIHIEGVGYRRFQDKMHKRWTDRCDIWNESEKWCLSFGKNERMVTVFNRPVTENGRDSNLSQRRKDNEQQSLAKAQSKNNNLSQRRKEKQDYKLFPMLVMPCLINSTFQLTSSPSFNSVSLR